METLNYAADLNAYAISLLQNRENDKAIFIFNEASIELRLLAKRFFNASDNNKHVETDTHLEVHQSIHCINIAVHNEISLRDDYANEISGLKFYNRAFTMTGTLGSKKDFDRLNVIILFNLALAHQIKGIRTGVSKELAKAKDCYNEALDLLYVNKYEIMEPENMLLILLALWNNMGDIHSRFFDFSETIQCFEFMERLVQCSECALLEECDYDFFCVNLLVNPQEQHISAPIA